MKLSTDKIILSGPVTPSGSNQLLAFLQNQIGQNLRLCYQCGKCSAGCPVSYAMDLTPRQVMRAIQFGLTEEVLDSSTIWLCLSCQVCTARCPREIDIAKVMEALRHLALVEKREVREKEVALFNNIFLSLISRLGRIYEIGLAALYNLRSGHPLTNIGMLPSMISRGKLPILPPRIEGAKQVRRIFNRVKAIEKESS